MKTAVIIGAGCSAGLAGLPTDNTFLRDCEDEILKTPFLYEAIARLYSRGIIREIGKRERGESWTKERLEVCWNEIDENFNYPKITFNSLEIERVFSKLMELASKEDNLVYKYYTRYAYQSSKLNSPYQFFFLFAGWELRRIVVQRCMVNLTSEIKDNYSRLINKIKKIANVHAFISFNYDVLLESALPGYSYAGFPGSAWTALNKTTILKPHGSINWLHCPDEQKILPTNSPIPLDQIGFKEKEFYQHSVIGLVGNKREFTDESHPKLEVYRLYKDGILSDVGKVLRESERLIIIGYSFPLTDGHIREIFSQNCKSVKNISMVDLCTPNNKSIALRKASELLQIPSDRIDYYSDGVKKWIELD